MTQPPPDQQPTQHPLPQWPVAQPPAPNPYAGGGQGGYGGGYGGYGPPQGYQPPPSSGGSGKMIAIIVGSIILVVLLFCGGIIGLIWWGVEKAEDAYDDFDPNRVGGRSNPITVEQGEAFEIDGVEYDAGWSIQPPADAYSGDTIIGLSGTNDREDESSEYVSLSFTFVDAADIEVGEITCHTDGHLSFGNSEELECSGYDKITESYDHIEVSAS